MLGSGALGQLPLGGFISGTTKLPVMLQGRSSVSIATTVVHRSGNGKVWSGQGLLHSQGKLLVNASVVHHSSNVWSGQGKLHGQGKLRVNATVQKHKHH